VATNKHPVDDDENSYRHDDNDLSRPVPVEGVEELGDETLAKIMAEADWRCDELAVNHPDGWYDMDAYTEHSQVQHVYKRKASSLKGSLGLHKLRIAPVDLLTALRQLQGRVKEMEKAHEELVFDYGDCMRRKFALAQALKGLLDHGVDFTHQCWSDARALLPRQADES
jgi:hypothetical protein